MLAAQVSLWAAAIHSYINGMVAPPPRCRAITRRKDLTASDITHVAAARTMATLWCLPEMLGKDLPSRVTYGGDPSAYVSLTPKTFRRCGMTTPVPHRGRSPEPACLLMPHKGAPPMPRMDFLQFVQVLMLPLPRAVLLCSARSTCPDQRGYTSIAIPLS